MGKPKKMKQKFKRLVIALLQTLREPRHSNKTLMLINSIIINSNKTNNSNSNNINNHNNTSNNSSNNNSNNINNISKSICGPKICISNNNNISNNISSRLVIHSNHILDIIIGVSSSI